MEREPPVKEGDVLELMIASVGAKGDGIAKKDGFVLFIPNTRKGDYVKIKITKVLPKAGFAEVVEKLERPQNQKIEHVVMEKRPPKEEFNAHEELDSEEF